METEISNIASLFNTGSINNLSQTAQSDKVQDDFSTFMNLNSFNQSAMGAYKTGNHAGATVQGNDATSYDRYQYKSNTVIRNAEAKNITPEKLEKAKTALEEFAEDVKSVLKEELSVTDEQIENAMAALGMNVTDLLDAKNLAALVTELTGCENPVELLMTDGFQNVLSGVEEVSEALLEELGMSKEEFLAVCDELAGQAESTVKNEDNAPELQTDEAVATGQTDEVMTTTGQTDVIVTVADSEKEKNVPTEESAQIADEMAANAQSEAVSETESETNAEQKADRMEIQTESEDSKEGSESMEADAEESDDFFEKSDSKATERTVEGHNSIATEQHAQPVDRTSYAGVQQTTQAYVDTFDVIEQISEYTKVLVSGETTSFEMQLNPENLGKIYVHVSEKAGSITAQITATNENVREALQAQVADLKVSLNQQGIKVEAVEVTVESHEFEQNLEENAGREQGKAEQEEERRASGGRRNINLNDLDSLSGIMSEEESLVAKMMQENGNQMDITV